VGGFPVAECAEIMVREAASYEPLSLERVVFAVFGDEAKEAFRRALETAQS
jgi:O-acetyl-ADP-ribose deacetylase (regulator of RNase III)